MVGYEGYSKMLCTLLCSQFTFKTNTKKESSQIFNFIYFSSNQFTCEISFYALDSWERLSNSSHRHAATTLQPSFKAIFLSSSMTSTLKFVPYVFCLITSAFHVWFHQTKMFATLYFKKNEISLLYLQVETGDSYSHQSQVCVGQPYLLSLLQPWMCPAIYEQFQTSQIIYL